MIVVGMELVAFSADGIELTSLSVTNKGLVELLVICIDWIAFSIVDIGLAAQYVVSISLVRFMFSSVADNENDSGNVSLCRRLNSFIMLLPSFALWILLGFVYR